MDMPSEAGIHLSLPTPVDSGQVRAIGRLVLAVQELSLAHSIADVQEVVRHAARELTGCDGATFVLRDSGQCYYADEDAIAPLWKGSRFPLEACISGWSMLHRQPVVIPDIYVDARIPHEAYRPTFVKSLVMVPIRTLDPIGAIGNVARVLRAAFRSSDVLARMGGDEFCALVVDTELDEVRLRQRIDKAFAEFNHGSSRLYPLSASIGVVAADPADDIDELLAQADARMYAEKRTRPRRQVN